MSSQEESNANVTRKAPRFHPGTVARREVKRLKRDADQYSLRKAPFDRWVRAKLAESGDEQTSGAAPRVSARAVDVLQSAMEAYAIDVLGRAAQAAKHADRVTVTPADLQFAVAATC